jgi:dihydrofolate reductase
MRKLVVLSFISLDGVMQGPGGPGEDDSGGFKYGGWTVPYFDDELGRVMGQQMGHPFDLLLGHKTFDIFAGYWPKETGPVGDPINRATKYVVSHSAVKSNWEKTVPITGDVAARIKQLKAEDGPELQVHGSGNLIQTLLKHDLVDEFWLKIYPLVLGSGKRLFAEGTVPRSFGLVDGKITPAGIIIANYARAGEVKIGSFEPAAASQQA